jgi:hypothetical protein
MTDLPTLVPDVDYLLSLEAEELASYLLVSLAPHQNRGQVHLQNLTAYAVNHSLIRPATTIRDPTR